jgi:hypothetical protein
MAAVPGIQQLNENGRSKIITAARNFRTVLTENANISEAMPDLEK